MYKLAAAILLISAPAFAAEENSALRDCQPIGQTVKGDMVYGLDCKALKAENKSSDYKPGMAETNLKDTVIPKSGGDQKADTAPTTGEAK
jgi:hypothetical protein